MKELTYEQFLLYLRSALHYLYDPVHLRGSPLIELLGLTREFDTAAALQQRLTVAIRQLKPPATEAPQARAWRIYDTLNFQYVRQLSRDAVALQLGISERQLRREQRVALEVLAQHLWSQLNRHSRQPGDAPATTEPAPAIDQALSEELLWLKKSAAEPALPLGEALRTVQLLAQPLAHQWQVTLLVEAPPAVADLPVAPLALRSILLTLLSVALPQADGEPVRIVAARGERTIELTVTCGRATQSQPPLTTADTPQPVAVRPQKDLTGLQTVQTLAAFYDARLTFPPLTGNGFAATLTLAAPEQLPVLVIDDNSDWLALQQRYAAGSRYQVIGVSDPARAHSLAEKLQPALILLDVMMHNVDGWQVLSELRHDPATAQIPIIICTILPVAELALALGASAFLQKPVTQQQFLQTLDDWVIG
ncbi:MAG: response regulator [Caldilinea sp. CFX5]|nr:response regulator [Caldilinea sp. CFX5]